MGLVRRLLTHIDDRLAVPLERHLAIAIPTQRKSTSPLSVMPSRDEVERTGVWPHCDCCRKYFSDCAEIHRTPCDVHDVDGGAA